MSTIQIKRKAEELGYLACRIIPSAAFNEYTQALDKRVASFPESKELYEPLYAFAAENKNARSIIVCTQRYNRYKVPESLKGRIGKMYLFDSRLSYSQEFRFRNEFETYLKTLGIPLLEGAVPSRWAAVKAGVGKFGRNNFIYSPEHGSYIIIHSWVTDKELEYDEVEENYLNSECKENCQKCVSSCPTGALSGSLSMDRSKCIAQLSFFAKDIPDEDTRSKMGLWLYGCDVCQDLCPLNKDKFTESEEFPLLREFEEYLKPENLLSMDEDTYTNLVNPRFWYIEKENLWLWKCNALRFMANSGEKKYHDLIKKHCDHEDQRVRETALWGCNMW